MPFLIKLQSVICYCLIISIQGMNVNFAYANELYTKEIKEKAQIMADKLRAKRAVPAISPDGRLVVSGKTLDKKV